MRGTSGAGEEASRGPPGPYTTNGDGKPWSGRSAEPWGSFYLSQSIDETKYDESMNGGKQNYTGNGFKGRVHWSLNGDGTAESPPGNVMLELEDGHAEVGEHQGRCPASLSRHGMNEEASS